VPFRKDSPGRYTRWRAKAVPKRKRKGRNRSRQASRSPHAGQAGAREDPRWHGPRSKRRKLVEWIGDYADAYQARFNSLRPHYQSANPSDAFITRQPIAATVVYIGADGVVVFYVPADDPNLDSSDLGELRGLVRVVASDPAPKLTRVLQVTTSNLMYVLERPTTPLPADLSTLDLRPLRPPDVPDEEIRAYFSGPLHAARQRFPKQPLTGMGVAPIWRTAGGRVIGARPTRLHVWSPIVTFPDGQTVRQYAWTSADLLWQPELLDLRPERAREFADADLHVLRLALELGLPPQHLSHDPYQAVSDALLRICDEFEALINRPDIDEDAVQIFLESREHSFLLAPIHVAIYPEKRLGRLRPHNFYVPDFTVLRPDNEYHFIEIEDPSESIYQAKGQEQAAHLTHAIGQVKDWLRYVDRNRESVRTIDGLSTIDLPTGEVIAGRDSNFHGEAYDRFKFDRAQPGRITLRTYDMVLADARAYARVLLALRSPTAG
jgi:hypothetical protein